MSLFRNDSHSCARITAAIALMASSALAAQAQVVFSPPKNISNSSGNTQSQQIAVDSGGNINIVWLDSSPGSYAVFFSRSSDGGENFSSPQNVSSNASGAASGPELAIDSKGNVFVLWTSSSPGNSAVFFSRSVDGGTTFSAPQLISNVGSYGFGGQMAVDSSDNIDVVWSDSSSVLFTRSTDGGVSFSPAQSVSINSGGGPQLAMDSSGNINVVWQGTSLGNYDIWFSRSADGGTTFSPAILVESSPISSNFFDPSTPPSALQIAVDGSGTINLIWADGSFNGDWFDFSVRSSHSTDGGTTFSLPQTIGGFAGGMLSRIDAGPSGSLNVLFQFNPLMPLFPEAGITDTLKRSVDGGATFSAAWSSNSCGDANGAPAVATEPSGRINVAYGFFGGPNCPGGGLFFTQSSDGSNFSAPQNVSGNSASSWPLLTTGNGNVYVVWQEETSPRTSVNENTFFSRSVALASATLSAANLTGGSSSTGTVTMNGPAPAGGAVISLTSSDPSVTVPASVTIAEGTTSATFTATTSPVATATTATISAAFSGVTQTASITVEPPVLTSLALSSSSVSGGSSTTATVTLSGPAPAGGSVMALASSNASVATVPSSVTVAPGFTNVTFTVSTSRELCPSAAAISASFSGVTQTSNLAVQPFVNLPSQACAAITSH